MLAMARAALLSPARAALPRSSSGLSSCSASPPSRLPYPCAGALSRILERGARSAATIFKAVVFTFVPTALELTGGQGDGWASEGLGDETVGPRERLLSPLMPARCCAAPSRACGTKPTEHGATGEKAAQPSLQVRARVPGTCSHKHLPWAPCCAQRCASSWRALSTRECPCW